MFRILILNARSGYPIDKGLLNGHYEFRSDAEAAASKWIEDEILAGRADDGKYLSTITVDDSVWFADDDVLAVKTEYVHGYDENWRVEVDKIILHSAEGRVSDAYPIEFSSFEEANRFLQSRRETVTHNGIWEGGYYKHQFEIIYLDGESFAIRYDLDGEATIDLGGATRAHAEYLLYRSKFGSGYKLSISNFIETHSFN